MEQQKIVFVSHCILNTAAKVARNVPIEKTDEERVRRTFLGDALKQGIQLIQLPCPEFTLYGPSRWGHTKDQFDNPFFRDHCREILEPVIRQMKAYCSPALSGRFQVLGIIGVEGSPSCGVSRTCRGPWGGEFSGRQDLKETLSQVSGCAESGVLIEVLKEMLEEEGIDLPVIGLNGRDPKPLYELLQICDREA